MARETTRELADAASEGNAERMRSLISEGATVNPAFDAAAAARERREFAEMARRSARENGFSREEARELAAQFEIREAPYSFEIPLHASVEAGCVDCVRVAIQAGAIVNRIDSDGRTALAYARFVEIAQMLLDAGADLNAQDARGYDVLDAVLGVDQPGEDEGEAVDDRISVGKWLLEKGVAIHRLHEGWSRLHRAAFSRNSKAVDAVLALGHTVEVGDAGTALHAIAWHFEYGDERDEDTVLMMRRLIDAGCDVNAVDTDGCTALHDAVAGDGGNPTAARVLLDAGADPNARNNEGESPLVYLFYHGFEYEMMVPLLLERGADPLLLDNRGKHAIDAAKHIAGGGEPPWREKAFPNGPPAQWAGRAPRGDPIWGVIRRMEEAAKPTDK